MEKKLIKTIKIRPVVAIISDYHYIDVCNSQRVMLGMCNITVAKRDNIKE